MGNKWNGYGRNIVRLDSETMVCGINEKLIIFNFRELKILREMNTGINARFNCIYFD